MLYGLAEVRKYGYHGLVGLQPTRIVWRGWWYHESHHLTRLNPRTREMFDTRQQFGSPIHQADSCVLSVNQICNRSQQQT